MKEKSAPDRSPFDLSGEVAVVTGAFGNLGPVWSRALLEAGATVIGVDLDPGAAPELLQSLEARFGDRYSTQQADVTDRGALERVRERSGEAVTILVNNAGIDQPPSKSAVGRALEELPLEPWRRVLEVNLLGAFQACQVFGGAMAARGKGAIVNIGSLYASHSPDNRYYDHIEMTPPFMKPPAYGASKAGLVNLTRYLATIWAPRNVRVNCLSPGGVRGKQDDDFRRKFTARVPLGRMAEADDLVGPLVFLASDASRYVTGIDLMVDGGYSAW